MAQFISIYTMNAEENNYILGAFDPKKVEIIDADTVFAPLGIMGNAKANHITGNAEGNYMNGGAGQDTMVGGAGGDQYFVDDIKDVITELANGGSDTVNSNVSYTLSAYVENLFLAGSNGPISKDNINGTGNDLDNYIGGNGGNNVLLGLDGNDTLSGGNGADTLDGGQGNDLYYVNDVNTVVVEGENGGYDTVWVNVENFDVSKLKNIEVVKFSKDLPSPTATYTGLLDSQGHPLESKDTFIFNNKMGKGVKAQKIKDFNVKSDSIFLSKDVFSKVNKGTLKKSAFHIGTKAHDSNDKIIYNAKNGALYYDKDGSGKAAAVKFATLDAHLKLTAADFFAL